MKLPLIAFLALTCTACLDTRLAADETAPTDATAERPILSKSDIAFFETSIRPLLVEKCYECHSASAEELEGGLLLDSRQGIAAGGTSGQVVNGRDPRNSPLIQAVRWTDPSLQMPPDARLSAPQIAALERWVSIGAPDPREATATTKPKDERKIDLDEGRKWWAFQPVGTQVVQDVSGLMASWPKTKIDHFVLAKLAEQQLTPSPAADPGVLVRRAYLDLTGLRPTYEQVQAFANDDAPNAFERVVTTLLDSPHYGERWGRHWLDVVRYGEDNFTGEATTPGFPFAWRYRDWVIEAINQDVPYDRFVKLQLAADLMPDVERRDWVALGFLGAAPSYHKDGRLSKDVIETLYTDDWDERVDTVSRGLLGLTVACARCHDHKFDPIPTSDYYRIAGVFASTVQAPRPLAEIDPAAETKFMADSKRVFYLSYAARLLRDDPGSKPVEAREKVIRFRAEMEAIKEQNSGLRETHPELYQHLSGLARMPKPYPDEPKAESAHDGERGRRQRGGSTEPIFQAVYDAGFFVDGADPDFTMLDIRPGEPRDLNVLAGGNVTRPGIIAPRGFLSVLAKGNPTFQHGSGRLELAERIFSDAAPLSARVMVNRVWAWHFGKSLVATPSDFGSQGERPTHPRLLDDLAARFIENDYSMKWLHREIMLSATYRQSSRPRPEAAANDPDNHFLWRMNPRRLDIEAYRDCMLQASGKLNPKMAGPSDNLDRSSRRTVYGRVSRGRPTTLLQLYDFPSAKLHSPQRESTTSPLQQLFTMNSQFIQAQADALVQHVNDSTQVGADHDEQANVSHGKTAMVRAMYRRVLTRDPTDNELQLAKQFLETSTPGQFAQALMATNEMIFWP